MATLDKSLLDLSTEVVPSLTFTVDGEPYALRTISHLSKLEEARLRTLNKQEEAILAKVETVDPEQEAVLMKLHERLFDLRIELITMMTDLPKEKAEKLPPMQQQKLINFVGLEVETIRQRMAATEAIEEEVDTGAEGESETPNEEE
ncbi:hypothetical protein LCGC14_2811430 [marine sediment metagenome]|uniref:Uncharacterized protein n=1 Tax=marine sediment metagenome TaxID=412755 RepID=A0A0F8Z6J2_9ZZZZ